MESTPLPESVDENRKTARQFATAYVTKGERGTGHFGRHCSPEVKKRQQDSPISPSSNLGGASWASSWLRRKCQIHASLLAPPCEIGPQGGYFPQPFHMALQTRRLFQLTYLMTDEDERELQTELARLQQEHRDLDAAIDALHQAPAPDLWRLQRLKTRTPQL